MRLELTNSWRKPLSIVTLISLFAVGACTSVPEREFKAYTAAFDEVKSATEQLLLDMDGAQNLAKAAGAQPKKKTGSAPFPLVVDLTSNGSVVDDTVAMRRRSLEVVSRFNTVLISLAAGRKPAEVKSSVDSLISGFKNIAGLVGKSIPVPGGAGDLAATIIGALEKANNRKQFAAAAKKAQPVITAILDLFRKDAEDVYKIMALDAKKRSARERRKVSGLVRQMQGVASLYKVPTIAGKIKRIETLEKKIQTVLGRVDRGASSAKLQVKAGPGVIDELAYSQLEQSLTQAEQAAGNYRVIKQEQLARYQLAVAYGKLLRKTVQSLGAVRAGLDRPADIRAQAMELIGFSFDVKRNLKALNEAPKTATAE